MFNYSQSESLKDYAQKNQERIKLYRSYCIMLVYRVLYVNSK